MTQNISRPIAPTSLKCLAVLVSGLLSGAAFAQVTVGGKVDVGYQFARSANTDGAASGVCTPVGIACGGTTKETMTDGSATTSRITFVSKEDLGSGMNIEANMDLRFTGGYEQGKTGLTTSDKRVLIFRSPIANVVWGVSNLGGQIYFGVTEKPYMISPKDLEIVKYGVSQLRESSLTSRNTTIYSPTFSFGPVSFLVHGTYAFGDNRAGGTSNVDNNSSGDVSAAGFELKATNVFSMGADYNMRRTTSNTAENGMIWTHTFVNVKPIAGLKLAASYNTYKGYNAAENGAFQEKNTNFVVSYNLSDKLEVGAAISHLNDVASSRNSGKATMIGAAYFLSKQTFVYAAASKTDFESNQGSITNAKYDGTAAGFLGNATKSDAHLTRVGIVKEF